MITLETAVYNDCTLGRMRAGAFQCFTLELPDRGNLPNISCIPAGVYKVTKYQSPSKGLVLLLHDVPGRTWIEVHAGTYTRQILGCILTGDSIRYLDADSIPDVANSVATLKKLLTSVPDETTIAISRAHVPPSGGMI